MDQGSNKNHSPAYNFAPTVTKFCVMWEGQALPHDTKFGNCRCKIVDSRAFPSWSLIHGLRWSGLIKAEPALRGKAFGNNPFGKVWRKFWVNTITTDDVFSYQNLWNLNKNVINFGSWSVMKCVKLPPDWIMLIKFQARGIFTYFQLYAHKPLVKWWKRKHFLCYWPLVRGIHQSPVTSHCNERGHRLCSVFSAQCVHKQFPDSKVDEAGMGPTWVMLAPDGPHVGPMNLAISKVHIWPILNRSLVVWTLILASGNLNKHSKQALFHHFKGPIYFSSTLTRQYTPVAPFTNMV